MSITGGEKDGDLITDGNGMMGEVIEERFFGLENVRALSFLSPGAVERWCVADLRMASDVNSSVIPGKAVSWPEHL